MVEVQVGGVSRLAGKDLEIYIHRTMDDIDALTKQGEDCLLNGEFSRSQWSLDSAHYLSLHQRIPCLWQRGLACFYCGHYEEAAAQFKSDMIANGCDIEEVLWHFLSRAKGSGFHRAKQDGFLGLRIDCSSAPPPPMPQVLKLYQGLCTVQSVLAAAADSAGSPLLSYNDTSAIAYAHFYIGLYHEVRCEMVSAEQHLRAAADLNNPDFMGKLMTTHYELFCRANSRQISMPSFELGQKATRVYQCPSIIQGGWQLSEGHLKQLRAPVGIESNTVIRLLKAYDAGIHAFDCGDIYTGVERAYGRLIQAHRLRGGKQEDIHIHTKLVPDLDVIRSGRVDGHYIKSSIRRSLNRLGVRRVNLVQLHWWDVNVPGYVQTARLLSECVREGLVDHVPGYVQTARLLYECVREGLVDHVGLTNFDTDTTREILSSGVPIATTQIQYSLLDRRPLTSGLVALCADHGIRILAYGVLAGGFLSDRWLGAERPQIETLDNRSLHKYLLIIDEFGGWGMFQKLLQTLRAVADRHRSKVISKDEVSITIAMVAIQYVLRQEEVGGVIIGAHNERHLQSTVSSTLIELLPRDLTEIESVLARSSGPLGGVFGLEREIAGVHGRIMKYNLSQVNGGEHLDELCHRYLQLHFSAYPVEATRTGYRLTPPDLSFNTSRPPTSRCYDFERYSLLATKITSYDHFLDITSEKEINLFCDSVQLLLEEAKSIDLSRLSPDQCVDHQIIISQLTLELLKWQTIETHKKDPLLYLPLNAVLYLLPTWGPAGTDPGKSEGPPGTELGKSEGPAGTDLGKNEGPAGTDLGKNEGPAGTDPGKSAGPAGTDLGESEGPAGTRHSHPGVADMTDSHKLSALLSRLRMIPTVLINAHHNLTSPAKIFVETAIDICTSFASFLANDVTPLCESMATVGDQTPLLSGDILTDISIASSVAAKCVEKYRRFLYDNILPVSSTTIGVGKEVYDSILRYSHCIESSEELLALGESHFQLVKKELENLAKEIDPSKTWQEITETVINPMHPTADNLLPSYMSEIQRAKEHMVSMDLVSNLPNDEQVIGFSTPKFLVPFSPVGDYLNPSPFAGMGGQNLDKSPSQRVGHLMLHSIADRNLPREEEDKLLRGHDFSWISVVSPHESYPGHHVQALLAQNHPRVLRKYHESVLFYEGWGLYTEELAYETGFYSKDLEYRQEASKEIKTLPANVFEQLTRLTQLRLRLWRAARVILDAKLNLGELSFEECREFLHTEVALNEGATKGEVFMYASRPGNAPCYVAGFVMIMKLREEMRRRAEQNGETFSLKYFHDCVLSHGCIPFKLLRSLL